MTNAELMQEFLEGKATDAYEYFGAHPGKGGVTFRTYAPNACGVNIFGDFNGWTEEPMERDEQGVWTFVSKKARQGDLYKYVIYGANGWRAEHTDPYAFAMELRPNSAAMVWDIRDYSFHDEAWMKAQDDHRQRPLSIYEAHIGSFRRNPEDENGWYNYREIAGKMIDHVKTAGYTHIELMPVCEYPFDGSWGYQLTGYYAPTSRYGTPADLKYFVDECHKAGIGVIMDFVPVHFAIDDYALKLYDTTALYEYYPAGAGSQWGTCMFDHSRKHTVSFLLSAAHYWLKEFHFDGLRVDAVSNLIYNGGEQSKGENRAGMEFARQFTTIIKKKHPKTMLFAEDSSAWQGGVTKPVKDGGLGFDYKWDMGWMYDSLYFLSQPEERRCEAYHKMTFSMWYFYTERFILSLSHDEVVGGAGTILEKINGDDAQKFAQARAYYAYMYAHPGKKLSFMGNELGERTEWNESREVEFELLKQPLHKGLFTLICDLQKLYTENEVYYADEYARDNFVWLYCEQNEKLLYVMKRMKGKKAFVTVLNFRSRELADFELKLDPEEEEEVQTQKTEEGNATAKKPAKKAKKDETWTPVLDSNWKRYGGSAPEKKTALRSKKRVMTLNIPAYSAVVYEVSE